MTSDTEKSENPFLPTPIFSLPGSITVRSYCPSDAPLAVEPANNIKIWRNLSDRFPHPYTLEDSEWWINHSAEKSGWLSTVGPRHGKSQSTAAVTPGEPEPAAIEDEANLLPCNYAICHEDKPVGSINLQVDAMNPFSVALGYWIAEPFWGKGIVTRVATAFCNWAFDTFPWLTRIDGDAFSWNQGSQKVLKKIGFVEEGIRRLKVCKEGKFGDQVLFGLVRKGWTPKLMETKDP